MIDFYQTIPELEIKGKFNTPEEFDKIGLPKEIKGWTVLDIGCNMGAYLIECYKRGSTHLDGIEPNQVWRLLAQGVFWEFDKYNVVPKDDPMDPIIWENLDDVEEDYDLVLLLSITHVAEGTTGQEILDRAWELTAPKGLLIVEINDRLQKEVLRMPEGAKVFGKSKDNRTVWHCRK